MNLGAADLLELEAHDDTWSPQSAPMVDVKRELVRNLWFRLFGTVPDTALTSKLSEYFTWGGTCVLGDTFHSLLGGKLLARVESIRDAGLQAAMASPGGRKLHSMWMAEEGGTSEDATRVVQQMVCGGISGAYGVGLGMDLGLTDVLAPAGGRVPVRRAAGHFSLDHPHARSYSI